MCDAIPDDLIDLIEAAKILKICRQTITRWILNGRMTGYRVGHRWRVSRADVINCVKAFTTADANDRKIAEERARPMNRREHEQHEKEIDEQLRAAGIRR